MEGRRRPERSRANERYRSEFLAQSAGALREFAALLAEEPEAIDSVCFELGRLAETAGRLDLPVVAQSAKEAADEVRHARSPGRALRKMAHAVRKAGGRLRFGPILLVEPPPGVAAAMASAAAQCCEPLAVYADVDAFLGAMLTEEPNAVLLPARALELACQLVQRDSFPVFVHGAPTDTDAFVQALSAGAAGYLVQPFGPSDVLAVCRARSQPLDQPADVLVIASASPACDPLIEGLAQVGLAAHAVDDAPQALAALDARPIAAVIVWGEVSGKPALPFVQLVRAHPRHGHLPILAFANADEANALRALGVEDAMRVDVTPVQAGQRVRERIDRLQGLRWTREPSTDLLSRLGALEAIDAELARAARSGTVVSVAMMEVDGLRTPDLDNTAVHRARRLVGALLRQHFRRTDLVGELALGELVLALPTCPRAVAERRLEDVARRFADAVATDADLSALRLEFGVVDTTDGSAAIGARAERALRRSSR